MFTGIIREVGIIDHIDLEYEFSRSALADNIINIQPKTTGSRLSVNVDEEFYQQLAIGDSIAVHGVCLTVVELYDSCFTVDVSNFTLKNTNLGLLHANDEINLELAMRANERIGGHQITGHVDCVGEVLAVVPDGQATIVTVRLRPELLPYVVPKGSIAVNGVSLTVAAVHADLPAFDLNLIPHTKAMTTFAHISVNDLLNLEIDVLARYVGNFITQCRGMLYAAEETAK